MVKVPQIGKLTPKKCCVQLATTSAVMKALGKSVACACSDSPLCPAVRLKIFDFTAR